ncbi:dihydrolipoamide acetyltransferase family protein [Qipengyuania zhejiangensis]|uniref:dihydrolipoamide acetyltransferase family protein n=1 Tax=Qipengyuania zhejiangensis TaxID=3077782 RepID=UPI002D769A79|nr:dihydrolipoamide acetyltransferase family protein [Qipengyuania sp. Z2]
MGAFTMPSLGAGMEAGTLVEWLKQPGDEIVQGDIIAVVETDKGAIEVEVFETGTLEKLLVEPGSRVPVGTPLATIRGAGEDGLLPEPVSDAPPPPKAPPVAVPVEPAQRTSAAAPQQDSAAPASPAARTLARDEGIDLATVSGSGPGGAIQLADVEAALTGKIAQKAAPGGSMRRAIAAAMARSKREIPHYYLTQPVDCLAAQTWLEAYNSNHSPGERLLLGALQLKAVALALQEYPEFNGFHDGSNFVPSRSIHAGLAISIRGGGLAAPAIHDTDKLSLADLMVRMRAVVERVRKGRFLSSEVSDPTVTVSSLGERGVETLLPIIYPPQVAIIGFGSPDLRPWAVGDAVAVRPIMIVSLGADHRVSDGHRGALLLRRIQELLQEPAKL